LTKTDKLLAALKGGKRLSAALIKTRYKITNPAGVVYNLRARGERILSTGSQKKSGVYYIPAR